MVVTDTPSRVTNRLSDRAIKSFIAKAKAGQAAKGKLSDGAGMFLTITPAGTPVWRVKYRLAGAEKLYSIGAYPEISLEDARNERDKMRAVLREGRDPVQSRELARRAEAASSENLFAGLVDAWLKKEKPAWSEIHYDKSKKAIERHVTPSLGKLPVRDITPAVVSVAIEAIQRSGHRETASKILQHVRSIFRLAQAKGIRNDNPADPVIEILGKAKRAKHRPALLTFPKLGELLRLGDRAQISQEVRLCHRLIAFTAVRIGNAVEARWENFDLDAEPAMWIIPREKMKMRDREHDHKVVLPAQIADELRRWHATLGKPTDGWVFPGKQGRSFISREGVEKALHMMGYANRHTPHGWRSSFSTLAREAEIEVRDSGGKPHMESRFNREVVELTLDHIHDNKIASAYDRGERLAQRIRLMEWWGDQLEQAQNGAPVIPIRKPQAA